MPDDEAELQPNSDPKTQDDIFSEHRPAASQRTFNFDAATLDTCIAALKPQPLQIVFRGLLSTAAFHPRFVTDIDEDGYVLLSATIETLATAAKLRPRWYQINLKKLKQINPKILVHSVGVNTMSGWLFNLKHVLPECAIDWFVDRVKNRDNTLQNSEQCAPHNSAVRPAVRGALFNRHFYVFSS